MPLTHITKCLLCPPDKPFQMSAGGFESVPSLGEATDPRLQRFFIELEKHLHQESERENKRLEKSARNGNHDSAHAVAQLITEKAKHLTQTSAIPVTMNMARAFLVATAFETTDPQLNQLKEGIRAHLHRATRKNNLTDETILHHVAQLGLEQIDADAVYGLLKEMRDILTEAGEYAPGHSGTEKARSSIIIP